MLPYLLGGFLWLSTPAIAAFQARDGTNQAAPGAVEDILIIECEDGKCVEPISKDVETSGGLVRHIYGSRLFYGLSVQTTSAAQIGQEIKKFSGVKNVWAAGQVKHREPMTSATKDPNRQATFPSPWPEERCNPGFGRPDYSHVATGIDRLHREGYTGSGYKIAIVDTGQFHGLFNSMSPSAGRGLLAVNSFGQSGHPPADQYSSTLDQAGTYVVGHGANGSFDFTFVTDQNEIWDGKERLLYDIDADYGDNPNDDKFAANIDPSSRQDRKCILNPVTSNVKDLEGKVALIRRGIITHDCDFYDRFRNALDRGATHILGWEDVPTKATSRSAAIAMTKSDVGRHMAKALQAGERVAMRRIGNVRDQQLTIARLSSHGPTWELDIKPDVVAPGEDVKLLTQEGGYHRNSGTSFSGPHVAGAIALIAEARGTLDPKLINSLLVSTARPSNDKYGPISVAVQGGGFLQAWDAAHATTIVEPAALAFSDMEHRVPSIALTIHNTAPHEVNYTISNLAANTIYAINPYGSLGAPDYSEGRRLPRAMVKLSTDSVLLGPDQRGTVEVLAADPKGAEPTRLPVWSGWIMIIGSDGTNLTVPYLGLAANLTTHTISAIDTMGIANAGGGKVPTFILPNPPTSPLPGRSNMTADMELSLKDLNRVTGVDVWIEELVVDTTQLRLDVVPVDLCSGLNRSADPLDDGACVPESLMMDSYGLQSVAQVPGFPKTYVTRNELNGLALHEGTWNGSIGHGQYAPPGRYNRVPISAMKLLALLGLASAASAHTLFTTLFVNGKNQGDGTCVRMPLDGATANGPIRPVTGDDMACNRDGGKAVAYTCPAPAKARLTFEFRMYSTGEQDGAIADGHLGPCAVYVKKVNDMYKDAAAGGGWFKIWEDGVDAGGQWCVTRLIANKGLLSVDLPPGLPRGYYLVRPEILALHNVPAAHDPQFYAGCAQVYVQDGPTGELNIPKEFQASIPGYVTTSTPGLTYNIYNKPLPPYPMPGPKVYIPGGPSSGAAGKAQDLSEQGSQPNDFHGAVPEDCLIKNANWCAKPLAKYTTATGCWAATKQCYEQSQACWDSAPPSGSANCKVWQEYCKSMEGVCGGGKDVTGPPEFQGKQQEARVPGDIPKPWNEQPQGGAGTSIAPAAATTSGSASTAPASSVPAAASTAPATGYGSGAPANGTSADGRCGGDKGHTCRGSAYGSCCSSMNWCGQSSRHCGEGCQGKFGDCK
ncbi:endoglucanase B [Purpureocillium lavendulum]|uniref:lytic cellulose monooxygenase (C4-dehydrogenating) n=1 Tax=Purpureocillium lavendulum TaxID=1247861 RepID=A0AB34G6G4_9HYPO|nr:endoglucanase B [Purpureocillium lavendulum]